MDCNSALLVPPSFVPLLSLEHFELSVGHGSSPSLLGGGRRAEIGWRVLDEGLYVQRRLRGVHALRLLSVNENFGRRVPPRSGICSYDIRAVTLHKERRGVYLLPLSIKRTAISDFILRLSAWCVSMKQRRVECFRSGPVCEFPKRTHSFPPNRIKKQNSAGDLLLSSKVTMTSTRSTCTVTSSLPSSAVFYSVAKRERRGASLSLSPSNAFRPHAVCPQRTGSSELFHLLPLKSGATMRRGGFDSTKKGPRGVRRPYSPRVLCIRVKTVLNSMNKCLIGDKRVLMTVAAFNENLRGNFVEGTARNTPHLTVAPISSN